MAYKNLKGPATPAQLALINTYDVKIEAELTKQDASDLISMLIKDKHPKKHKPVKLKKNRYTTPSSSLNPLSLFEAPRDKWGRKHGVERGIGNGEIHYEYGQMTFCDDGNGNTWHEDFDLFTDDDAEFWGLD